MRSRRRLVLNVLLLGLSLCLGTTTAFAQTPLEKLEQSVQTLPPPAAPAANPQAAAVEPGYLGIVADDVTTPTKGVQLLEVLPGGPAQLFGLQAGDFVTSIDGKNAATLEEMAVILATHPAGDEVTFIIRRGQEVLRADVKLGKRPPPEERKFGNFGRIDDPNAPVPTPARPAMPVAPPADPKMIPPEPPKQAPSMGPRVIPHPGDYSTPNLGPQPTPPQPSSLPAPPASPTSDPPPLLGVRAVPVTPEMQVSLNLPEPRGALIVEVKPNSPAHRVGLPLEAVIVAMDGKRIDSPTQLSDALQARGLGASVRISFFRYGQLSERVVKLGEGGPPPVVVAPLAEPLVVAPPAEVPGSPSPVAPTPTPAPPVAPSSAPTKPVPAPPEPALPPNVIASPVAPPNGPALTPSIATPPIATPVPAGKSSKAESENEALRLRVQELKTQLAEAEAKLKAAEKADKEKPQP